MRKLLLLFNFLLAVTSFAQNPAVLQPAGGGKIQFDPGDELTPAQRQEIISQLKQSTNQLERQGILPMPSQYRPMHVAFGWPLRQAAGFTDNGYYGISNYVDGNPAYPNQLRDYNCGNRTYDLSSGYNHAGTDIFTWPFPWDKMTKNAVEIIAAAPGTIIYKSDGNFDRNCAFCTSACNWNAVYVQHADGSVAWYGHMKTGSLTTKAVGQTVGPGEYLGVVGSSGNSTGPHLHFEVYTSNTYTQLVDPWAGACNAFNGTTSWWAAQEAYRVPTLSKIMTHGAAPASGTCPSSESVNRKLNFAPGETIYLGGYFRDNLSSTSATHRLYRPDGTLWQNWTQNFTSNFNASWWWYSWTLPTTGSVNGVWRYEVTYSGQTLSTSFGINTILPLDLLQFTAVKAGRQVRLNWITENETNSASFEIERSVDGNGYNRIATLPANNRVDRNEYSMVDNPSQNGKLYYRLRMVDRDGSAKFSKVAIVDMQRMPLQVIVRPTAFSSQLTITINGEAAEASMRLVNAAGQTVWQNARAKAGTITVPATAFSSGLYVLLVYDKNVLVQRQKLVKQ